MQSRRARCLVLSVCSGALFATPAYAQTNASAPSGNNGQDGDIIVTATKREQALQDVPLSITALSQATLEVSGATSFNDYAAKVPNLAYGYAVPGRQVGRVFLIRGIFGQDTSAYYIGDTPVPTSIDPRVMDVERIEVLRGPQGSLFGSRSMGGLVRVIPSDPSTDAVTAKIHVGAGVINEGGWDYRGDATVNVPLSDKAAFRFTAYYLRDGGFIDRYVDPDASTIAQRTATSVTFKSGDEYTVRDINRDTTYGGQAALKLEASDWLTVTPRFMYQHLDSTGPNYVDTLPTNLVKVRQFDQSETGRDDWWIASLELNAQLGRGSVISSTSYFRRETADVEDSTNFIASLLGGRVRSAVSAPSITSFVSTDRRFTQELRYVSNFGGAFEFILGGFYQRITNDSAYPAQSIFPAGSPAIGVLGIAVGDSFFSLFSSRYSTEYGVFGEANFKPIPGVTITAGGRYYDVTSDETRRDGGVLFSKVYQFNPPTYAGTQHSSGFNPKVAVTIEPSRELTFYANVAKGFRPGRVNNTKGACTALGFAVPDAVDADTLWNYEGGVKAKLFDGRLTTTGAGFYIKWDNRQTQTVNCGLGFGASQNVGSAISKGFEFDASLRVADGVTLSGSVGYTDAYISDIGTATGVAVGDKLANVPEWNGAGSLDIEQPINSSTQLYYRVDYSFVGSSISAQKRYRAPYGQLDMRLGTRIARFDVSLYVKNFLDKRANLSDVAPLSDSLNLIGISRPRTVGIDLRTKF